MTDQPYTPIVPTTEIVENQFVYYEAAFMNISNEASRARFRVWLEEIEASAEQRGEIKALRDVEASLIDWDVLYGHEQGTAEDHESIRIAAWIGRRADRMEGDDE